MKTLIVAVFCGLLIGAEEFSPKVAKDVYLDPKEAGLEYRLQGEYAGEVLSNTGLIESSVAYLQKPFTRASIVEVLRRVLGSGQA